MKWLAALVAVLTSCYAADWLSDGGDPQGTNWQRHGKALTVANVKNLKLLWKRQLGDQSLSSPVIIGPTITHRGVRELVFVAGAGDNLYALDADLGALFWTRHFDVQTKTPCAVGGVSTPVIEPDPDEDLSGDPIDEDDDDEAGPMRPLYAVASDGKLHTIRVSDGADVNAPIDFLPANASYSSLNFWAGKVYAGTDGGCHGAPRGLWSVEVNKPGAKPDVHSVEGVGRIVSGTTGAVYRDVTLRYNGRELLVTHSQDGRFLLLDVGSRSVVAEHKNPHAQYSGIASWQDSSGVRWIYAATAKELLGFQLTGPSIAPKLELAWTHSGASAGPPAVTNGLIFLLSGSALTGLDAATGKEVYSSGSIVDVYASHLAIANGHICFADSHHTLYCFGIPLER